jgi:high-affinity Fe2+/Pb2+ permease
MASNKNIKNENYLGFFLLIAALMLFATIVKSCNIARYQAEQDRMTQQHQTQPQTQHHTGTPQSHGIDTHQ